MGFLSLLAGGLWRPPGSVGVDSLASCWVHITWDVSLLDLTKGGHRTFRSACGDPLYFHQASAKLVSSRTEGLTEEQGIITLFPAAHPALPSSLSFLLSRTPLGETWEMPLGLLARNGLVGGIELPSDYKAGAGRREGAFCEPRPGQGVVSGHLPGTKCR